MTSSNKTIFKVSGVGCLFILLFFVIGLMLTALFYGGLAVGLLELLQAYGVI